MTTKQKLDVALAAFAAAGIITVEIIALSKGIDGIALTASVGALAGLGGFKIHQALNKEK